MPSLRVLAISVLRASPSLAPKPFESLVDHEQNFEEMTSKTTLGSRIELSISRPGFRRGHPGRPRLLSLFQK